MANKGNIEILLKGKQPLIFVLARVMKTKWEPEIAKLSKAKIIEV